MQAPVLMLSLTLFTTTPAHRQAGVQALLRFRTELLITTAIASSGQCLSA